MRLVVHLLIVLLGGGIAGAVILADPARVEIAPEPSAPEQPEANPSTCEAARGPSVRPFDVGAFDIGGLKLGMTLEDTQHIMECAHATERNVSLKEWTADVIAYEQQWREARKRGVVNTRTVERNCIGPLNWREQERRVNVDFVEDLPAHPGRMLIYQVSTEQDGVVAKPPSRFPGRLSSASTARRRRTARPI